MLQGHVLCSGERQPVCAVVVDQLGNTGEDAATLIQGEAQTLNALSLGHDDVHTALTGPDETQMTHTQMAQSAEKTKQFQKKGQLLEIKYKCGDTIICLRELQSSVGLQMG